MHTRKQLYIAALLAISILLSACLPSSGEMTRVALTAAGYPTKTPLAPPATPKPSTRTPTPLPTSDLGVGAADLQGVEITLWHPWSGALGKAMDALASDFNKNNDWGIKVRAVSQGSYDGLAQALAAAEPDELPQAITGYGFQAPDSALALDGYVADPRVGAGFGAGGSHPRRPVGARAEGREAAGIAGSDFGERAVLQPDVGGGAGLQHAADHARPIQSASLRRSEG